MDMESPISPSRERSLEPEEGQDIDLKVEITERLKHTAKNDSYISYKITTDVSAFEHLAIKNARTCNLYLL